MITWLFDLLFPLFAGVKILENMKFETDLN